MEDKVELVETNNLTRKQNIILYFFIYAFLGWLLETAFCILTTGVFTKRGFLYGPICPIYGFGAILLIESLKNIKVVLFATLGIYGLKVNIMSLLQDGFNN